MGPDRTGKKQDRARARLAEAIVGGAVIVEGRAENGRFAPGVSGNPRGRPRGSRDRRTLLLAELLDGGGEAIVKKLVDLAKKGKPWAVRLAVERLVPRHERRVEIDLPRVERADEVAAAVAAVIECAAAGELSLEEAHAFLRLIEQQRKGIEAADLALRLELLEQEQGAEPAKRLGFRERD